MIFSQSCVQFGGGRMGSVWVKALSEYFESVALVDPNTDVVSAVEDTHAHYFNLDVLDGEDINNEFNAHLRDYLSESAVWSMAIRPETHEKLIELALDEGIRGLLVEKPVANDLDKLEELAERAEERGMITGVDYIELVHPAYEAILRRAVDDGFQPGRGFHWRCKDLRYQVGDGKKYEGGVPFVKDDLCHDVSELYGLYRALAQSNGADDPTPNFSVKNVDSFDLWQDAEYREGYPFREFHNDIGAQVRLEGDNGAEFTIRGSYEDEEERRFFFWVGKHEKTAYYGNTLQRDFTTPAAYKIVGKDNIRQAEQELKSGNIVEKSDETELMNRVNAKPLSFPQTAYNERVSRMCRRIFSNDAPATLSDAVHIERVIESVYEEAGHTEAAYY